MTPPAQPHAVLGPRRRGASAVLLPVAVLLAACTSGTPESGAAPPSPATSAPGISHVHGVGIDPADDTLFVATHEGLFEVADGGAAALVSPVMDLMGFTVSGPGHFLASGHPGLRVDLPQPMGLIESTDGGRTWSPVSRQGRSDFHALTTSAAGVLGYDGTLVRSSDGTTWEEVAIPAEPHTLTASPTGERVLATTAQGLLRSTDGGRTWALVDDAPLLQVVDWAETAAEVAGVDPSGVVWTSTDGGDTWNQGAALGSAPQAVTLGVTGDGVPRVVVATAEALVESVDGGQTFDVVLEW
ncbi:MULTISPECIES: F510_1955 family glycosylhydrolase [unclassified Modestobacter]|uniref:F510_1955 family glycosylhydrolase n=1 Tax=unclassified Modestobacter TaxID=2643866 RepID=UPI0022AA9AE5|nr:MULTISPECIES: exo-alpha-sialidase [unclassified Modestobacter]MCZ2827193.1 exo-alpha-sialidase [Modestobacter sp. VKM Ac-2981]MCZ2854899.1 exo-alpha-sialidase [Modestobacter sp. VKM Ac-2982]